METQVKVNKFDIIEIVDASQDGRPIRKMFDSGGTLTDDEGVIRRDQLSYLIARCINGAIGEDDPIDRLRTDFAYAIEQLTRAREHLGRGQ